MKFYEVCDIIPLEDLERLGIADLPSNMLFRPGRDGLHVMAALTGEFRAPRKGEWYLSGAVPVAYRSPSDLSHTYRIMELVVVDTKTTVTHRIVRSLEVLHG